MQMRKYVVLTGLLVAAAQSGVAQTDTTVGVSHQDTSERRPTKLQSIKHVLSSPYVRTVGNSVGLAFAGITFGLAVDQIYCKQHHGDEKSFPFGPCFAYAGYGAAIGWFGGALIGASNSADRIAKNRGCSRTAALRRALAGSLVGVAPGVIIAAQRSGNYPPGRTAFLIGAPILAGVGAAAAISSCHN